MTHKYLYPLKKPYQIVSLSVDSIHTLQIRKFGNPRGIPVILVHGGPGAPSKDYQAGYFDKRYYNIILFDQRGCGTSRPLGELTNNNTQELIEDIEKVRLHCGFKKIILYGGSWGASLIILYLMRYPEKVIFFIIRSICLLKEKVFTQSYKQMYPEQWEKFISMGDPTNLSKTISKYFEKIKQHDKKYIQSWSNWELPCLNIIPEESKINMRGKELYYYCLLESYYFKNDFFLPPNFILNNLSKIKNTPGFIIHGRFDVICNLKDSYILSQSIKKSKLKIVESTGHHGDNLSKVIVECSREIISNYFKLKNNYYFS